VALICLDVRKGEFMATIPAQVAGPQSNFRESAAGVWKVIKATGRLIKPSARFFTTCEAHTYAYSVAANAILALVPFLVLLITLAQLGQSAPAERMIFQLVAEYLPAGSVELKADLVHLTSHHGIQVFSLIMLAISSSGVFLPFEVALNGVWGFPECELILPTWGPVCWTPTQKNPSGDQQFVLFRVRAQHAAPHVHKMLW
jgi:Virulence factor BrkB